MGKMNLDGGGRGAAGSATLSLLPLLSACCCNFVKYRSEANSSVRRWVSGCRDMADAAGSVASLLFRKYDQAQRLPTACEYGLFENPERRG